MVVKRINSTGRPLVLTEVAWAAGFWDGEGCLYLDKRSMIPSLQVSQSGDEAVALLERFIISLGVQGVIYDGWRRPENKPAFKAHIRSDQAQAAFGAARPYLSNTKIMQAEVAFRAWNERRAGYVNYWSAREKCKRGHLFDEANTAWKGNARRCRACRREDYYQASEGTVTRRRSQYKLAARVEVKQEEVIEDS